MRLPQSVIKMQVLSKSASHRVTTPALFVSVTHVVLKLFVNTILNKQDLTKHAAVSEANFYPILFIELLSSTFTNIQTKLRKSLSKIIVIVFFGQNAFQAYLYQA